MTYPIDTSRRSPNHAPRGNFDISMIVLHATVGNARSAISWLCNPATRVSTHYLIDKTGHIYQLVADDQIAWHAGRAVWHGIRTINERSIGIELENANDGRDPYPPAQIAAAHWLCQQKIARYNIERADVVRHLDIAIPKGRKTDPAGLPWPAFADSLYMDTSGSGDNPRPPHAGPKHYRVKWAATIGATIRADSRTNAPVLGRLKAGEDFWGEPVTAKKSTTVYGFGSSSIWIRSEDMRFIWSGLLDEVKE